MTREIACDTIWHAMRIGVLQLRFQQTSRFLGFDRGTDCDGTRLAFAVAADKLAVAPCRVSGRQFREGDGRLRADDQRLDEARAGQSFNLNARRALCLVLLFPPAGSGADCPAKGGAGSP
jgi:hypothetical protein